MAGRSSAGPDISRISRKKVREAQVSRTANGQATRGSRPGEAESDKRIDRRQRHSVRVPQLKSSNKMSTTGRRRARGSAPAEKARKRAPRALSAQRSIRGTFAAQTDAPLDVIRIARTRQPGGSKVVGVGQSRDGYGGTRHRHQMIE